MRSLKIGIVCPYGWDTPGGVQIHIKELTEWLIAAGHQVSVLAPVTDEDRNIEPWVVSAGRPISIPYNGAVAKVIFGPLASSRVKQWIGNGDFEAVVIPNGIDTSKFEEIGVRSEWALPNTLGFIGRFDEPRKGLAVLLAAIPKIVDRVPNLRVLVAGPGTAQDFEKLVPPELRERITFLGRISELEKAQFFKSISLYIAPNTGGESFGIILAEAMASKAPIVASNLPAFVKLLDNGDAGAIFTAESADDLSKTVLNLLEDSNARTRIAKAGYEKAKSFDWNTVGDQILSVYEMALSGNTKVNLASDNRFWNRLRSNG